MSDYKIIKNTPAPERHGPYSAKYNFNDMEVGDAIDVPRSEQNRLSNAARNWGYRNNAKFSTYKIDENTARCRRMA